MMCNEMSYTVFKPVLWIFDTLCTRLYLLIQEEEEAYERPDHEHSKQLSPGLAIVSSLMCVGYSWLAYLVRNMQKPRHCCVGLSVWTSDLWKSQHHQRLNLPLVRLFLIVGECMNALKTTDVFIIASKMTSRIQCSQLTNSRSLNCGDDWLFPSHRQAVWSHHHCVLADVLQLADNGNKSSCRLSCNLKSNAVWVPCTQDTLSPPGCGGGHTGYTKLEVWFRIFFDHHGWYLDKHLVHFLVSISQGEHWMFSKPPNFMPHMHDCM